MSNHGQRELPFSLMERPVEYEQALVNFRYFLDFKAKLFGFVIAINSLLYPIILKTLESIATKVIASLLVVILLLFAVIFDRRITGQIKKFLREAKRIEKQLDFELIRNIYPGKNSSGAFSIVYFAMYIVAILFWCLHILIISKILDPKNLLDIFTSFIGSRF